MTDSDVDVLEALASLPTMAHPTVSPDGDRVAFYYDISGRNELHVLDVETGEHEQVSDGEVPRNARWGTEWSADGDQVYFHLDDDGNEQNDVWAFDLDSRSAEPVVELDGQTSLSDVSDDGERLLLGSTRDGQMNVYSHDLTTDETTKLTDYERAAASGTFSPDGERIAYATNESDDFGNVDVYVADADGSNPRNLHVGEDGAEAGPADWHDDGRRLLVSDNTEDLSRCGVYDLDTDEVTWFGDLTAEEQPARFLDEDRFLAVRTRDAAAVPVVYDLETGEGEEFDVPEGVASSIGGTGLLDDGRVPINLTTPNRRPELLAYDLDSGETETLVDAEYGPFEREDFADAEYFTFESFDVAEQSSAGSQTQSGDGLEIGALLYDSGQRPSPLIVNPHGGPRAADYKSFGLYTQFLVSRGYSVLQVNYRGSTGRGKTFVDLLKMDWGGGEQRDIAEATELVSDYDWIDDDRVVVFGGSYGGYSAYCQTTMHPELYDAGIAWIGVTDLVDMYENTMPHFRTELMEKYLGTPEENPDLYHDRSPVHHAEHLDCPLLMVHGVNDRRVPVSQARIFRDRLEELGFEEGEDDDYEYVELGEEGHASSDIDQKIRLFEILDDFLERRVGTTVESLADD
ncbi:S9 family peptidase [Halomarina oriensis]|uniref:Prolyl oligopeptidase family serine peptidase n=1 Tax=Halomarina oriensis TaxID=671145 RepID=A0A6B0GLR9_9EURY|nr:prolyl oligopeptidase family serine peptidase [Halomarina oriensis]MWG33075.1 prolyl oligopeptidase family serine peptidase [Halomarina oriensis]